MNKLEQINEKYEHLSQGKIFPRIDNKKIIILEKGFYKKHKANYRGLSFIYDRTLEKQKAILIGYYYVPENIIIISDTETRNTFNKIPAGDPYKILDKLPSLVPYEFSEDTEEFQVAKENYQYFKSPPRKKNFLKIFGL